MVFHVKNNGIIYLIAIVIIVSTWLMAGAAIVLGWPILKIFGMVFIICKGIELIATMVGLSVDFRLAMALCKGRYVYDETGRMHHYQSLLRHVWEMPQMFVGYMLGMCRIIMGKVRKVETVWGVTFVVCEHAQNSCVGVSLGPIVNIASNKPHEESIRVLIQKDIGIYKHELGHTVDSLIWGWLYLLVIGLPSMVSVQMETMRIGHHKHCRLYAERWANRHGTWVMKQ